MNLPISLDDAVEVFARGFSRSRSKTYPFAATRVEADANSSTVWVMRDEPDRAKARGAELAAVQPSLTDVHTTVASATPPLRRWTLCYLEPEDPSAPRSKPPAPTDFRDAGYRRIGIEPIFVADPATTPRFDGSVCRVDTADLAERVRLANRGRRQLLPSDLETDDAPTRLFAAMDGRNPVGWVSSVRVGDLGCWVQNLYVAPEARKLGFGRALMSALLADDARLGVRASVLSASNDGSRLYPHLGYQQIATMHVLQPPTH